MIIETSESEDHYATTGGMLGPELLAKYPYIESYAAFGSLDGPGKIEHNEQFFVIKCGRKVLYIKDFVIRNAIEI